MGTRLPRPVPAPSGEHLPDQNGVLAEPVAPVAPVASVAPVAPEPTLAFALRRYANDQVPARFYLFLQLGIPWSVQFWIWGWRRTSMLLVVLFTFGLWALNEQALNEPNPVHPMARRIVRRMAGFVAGMTAAGLLFEGFIRLLHAVVRCPGCAG